MAMFIIYINYLCYTNSSNPQGCLFLPLKVPYTLSFILNPFQRTNAPITNEIARFPQRIPTQHHFPNRILPLENTITHMSPRVSPPHLRPITPNPAEFQRTARAGERGKKTCGAAIKALAAREIDIGRKRDTKDAGEFHMDTPYTDTACAIVKCRTHLAARTCT